MGVEERKKIIEEVVEDFLNRMSEYCDCTQILVSFDTLDDTHAMQFGKGNWYARQGMAREFINEEKARTFLHINQSEFGSL